MPTAGPRDTFQIGEWLVQPALDTISRGLEIHKLEPRMMRLLVFLADSAGSVVSIDRLLEEVWSGVVVGSASVYQAVSQLRKLLGDVDAQPTYIATIPRKGYRLVAPVTQLAAGVAGASGPMAGAPAAAQTPAAGQAPAPGASSAAPPFAADGPHSNRRWRWGTRTMAGGLAAIALTAALIFTWTRTTVPVSGNSIVVLPFVDLTAEKADQSFCDGLTEELSNWLSQIPTLRVVARTSAFAFRGRGEDVREIGKALDTTHILEGSMRRTGDRIRITVQLIDARNGFHLWSRNFDKTKDDAISVQEDISRSVADSLKVRLTAGVEGQFALRRTNDPDAYQEYLLARHFDQQLTPESTDQAIDLYRQVLRADPKFVSAYARLARAYLNRGFFHDTPTAEVAAQMDPLIASALRLDDRLSDAYAVRGALRAVQARPAEALEDLKRAIELDPSNMGAFAEIGRMALLDGRPGDSLKSYDHAAELDPLNSTLQEQRCTALGDLMRYEEAAEACERARILQPKSAAALDRLAALAESRGDIPSALRWNSEAIKAEPAGDFDLYWARAAYFLDLVLPDPARATVETGRVEAKEQEGADAALVRVVFCQSGVEGLRAYLNASHLDRSSHGPALMEAAYAHLLLGEATEVEGLLQRALRAPDLLAGFADSPWYARGELPIGASYRVDLAAAELLLGRRAEAEKQLNTVRTMIDRMITNGVSRHATYELRARVFALLGRGDEAMRDLQTAARLGWRRAWWATHEPYFASLRSRVDFKELVATIDRSNQSQIEKIGTSPSARRGAVADYLAGDSGVRHSTNAGKSTKRQGRTDG
ncbi:MAG: winged helix-turn-helix domain-containing protein [Steroidobacteraceae bacterium]|jgi:TolB-like protein/DNA-binding winged helix-turn-helix (wHTH) protein/tetratricopeptide (TPR) repeat protein